MAKPALVVVDGDRDTLAVLERALQRRFGADYQVLAAETPAAALTALGQAGEQGRAAARRPVARGHDRDPVSVPGP